MSIVLHKLCPSLYCSICSLLPDRCFFFFSAPRFGVPLSFLRFTLASFYLLVIPPTSATLFPAPVFPISCPRFERYGPPFFTTRIVYLVYRARSLQICVFSWDFRTVLVSLAFPPVLLFLYVFFFRIYPQMLEVPSLPPNSSWSIGGGFSPNVFRGWRHLTPSDPLTVAALFLFLV